MDPLEPEGKALDRFLATHPHPCEPAIPSILRASVERHQANLARLLQSLRAAGMDEAQIESAVAIVIDSYKIELLQAIRALKASDQLDEDTR